MHNPILRNVAMADLDLLREVSIQTFMAAFAHMNTPENMSFYLDQAFNNDQLSKELDNAESQLYFLEQGGDILGYLKINFGEAQTESVYPEAVEIQRIYLYPKAQGLGLGKYLIEVAEQIGVEQGCPLVWLGVWDKNEKSIGFYEKMGYTIFDSHDFPFGDDLQTDHLMKKNIFWFFWIFWCIFIIK